MIDGVYISFGRATKYPIGALRACEARLLKARQADHELSARWRVASGSHARLINLRNTELVPLFLFADHLSLNDDDEFQLMPEGNPADARIQTSGGILNLQITNADLDWEGDENAKPGYQRRLELEALNQYELVSGHGPFRRITGGIVGQESVYSNEERLTACRLGLVKALNRKANFDGRGMDLLVHAREFHIQTVDGEFEGVVKSAVSVGGRPKFDRVYIFDKPEGWFVEV